MTEQGSGADEGAGAKRPRSMWVRMISGTIVTVLVAVAAIFAFRADGEPVHDVGLTDGSVWVSGGRTGYWGQVNTGSHSLETVIGGAGATKQKGGDWIERSDVLQDGRNVVGITGVADATKQERELVAIDSTTGAAVEGGASVPATGVTSGTDVVMPDVVALNGDTLAVVDHQTGDLWATRLDPGGGTSIDGLTDEAPLENQIGPGAAVTVSDAGDIMVVSAGSGTVVEVPVEGDGFGRPDRSELPFDDSRFADITAVGDRWVVLDLEDGMVHAEDMADPRNLPGGGQSERGQDLALAVLQQAGPESSQVAVQTTERAEYVEIDRGSAGGGDVGVSSGLEEDAERSDFVRLSRPVLNGDCLYAAWGRGNGVLWGRACGDESQGVSELGRQGDIARDSPVEVRYNRGQVLLNDLQTGRVFDLSLTGDVRIDTWPGGAGREEPEPYVPDHQQSPSPTTSSTKSR